MISVSRLLCGAVGRSDSLRYDRGHTPHSQRKPIVVWNMTIACNLKCVHCYASARPSRAAGELTTAEGMRLIDELADFGCPVILFSGGEPLLRSDLFDLGRHAVERGLRAVISSNGTLIGESAAREMKKVGFHYVGISLDGLREGNDRFRGCDGAFDDALEGIRNLTKAGVHVGLRFTMNKRNVDDLTGIFELVRRERIRRLCFYHLVYSGRGSSLVREDLDRTEMRKTMDLVFDFTKRLHAEGRPVEVLTVDNHADGPYLYLRLLSTDRARADEAMELLRQNGGNGSGTTIACVDEVGNVHADQFWRQYSFGTVRQRKFGEIWTDTSNEMLRGLKDKKGMIKGRCSKCRFLDICGGGFRARAEAVHGDIWAPDPACYLTDEEIR